MLDKLESSLSDLYTKNTPKLSVKTRDTLVEWAPWVTLVFGILSLLSAYWLWHWAHVANSIINYTNNLVRSLGINQVAANRFGFGVWLALIVVTIEALLYLAAYSGLKARHKTGWNFIFYAALINIVYGVVVLFTNYGGVGNFIGALVGSAIGLYFLFQIRPAYKK